jgi:hypothetical protein
MGQLTDILKQSSHSFGASQNFFWMRLDERQRRIFAHWNICHGYEALVEAMRIFEDTGTLPDCPGRTADQAVDHRIEPYDSRRPRPGTTNVCGSSSLQSLMKRRPKPVS